MGLFYLSKTDTPEYEPTPGPFDTREQAVAAAVEELELVEGSVFWTFEDAPETETFPPIAERVIEQAQEWAYDECDAADCWLDNVSAEELERLRALLVQAWETWLDDTGNGPDWHTSVGWEKHCVVNGEAR